MVYRLAVTVERRGSEKSHAFGMGSGGDTSPQTVMRTVGRNSHEKAANHEEIR
jgi:hypothetical protein